MKFSHRLAYYLLGLLIGGIFFKFIIEHKGGGGLEFDYLPNARVLKNIRNKPFDISEVALSKMKQQTLDTADIKAILTNGDVDFDKSNVVVKGGKQYQIEGNSVKKKTIVLQIINYENKALLNDILETNQNN